MARFLRSYPNTYAGVRPAHSRLGAPVVVNPSIVFRPIAKTLATELNKRGALNPRRRPIFELRPPTKTFSAIIFPGLRIKLTYPTSRKDFAKTQSKLRPPTVVSAAAVAFVADPIKTTLVTIKRANTARRRQTFPQYIEPIIVNPAVVFRGIKTSLAPSARRRGEGVLKPPTVVTTPSLFVAAPVVINLAYSRRGVAKSRLRLPIVVGASYVVPKIRRYIVARQNKNAATLRQTFPQLFGPVFINAATVFRPVKVELAYSNRARVKSVLRQPIIIAAVVAQVYYGPQIITAYSTRGKSKSELFAPTVIGAATLFRPIEITLVPSRRGKAQNILSRPIIVQVVVAQVFYGPKVETTKFVRTGRSYYRSISPTVINSAVVFAPVTTQLTYSSRGKPESRLFAPAVINPAVIYASIGRKLAPTISLGRLPHSRLKSPTVVGAATIFRPIEITFAPSRRGKPKSRLFALPIVSVQTFYGPTTNLTYSTRGKIKSELSVPAVINAAVVYRPVAVKFVRGRAGEPLTKLFAPAVVGAARVFAPITTKLSPSTKLGRLPHAKLRAPAVIGAATVFAPIKTEIAPSTRLSRQTSPKLFGPTLVNAATVFRSILTHLAYSSRGKPKNELLPPTVVGAATVFRPIDVELAPSSRGRPLSRLRPPAVIAAQFIAAPVQIHLTPSKRGKPLSRLFAPAVVGAAKVFAPIYISIAPSFRGLPKSKFIIPAVVFPFVAAFYGPVTNLTYSSRGKPISKLRSPAVVDAATIFAPIKTKFAYHNSRFDGRRITIWGLRPGLVKPTVVFAPITTQLAYSSRGVAHSKLQPAIIAVQVVVAYYGPSVNLAYSRRGVIKSKLSAPVVLAPTVTTILTHLAYSIKGKPKSALRAPAVVGAATVFAPIEFKLVPSTRLSKAPHAVLREPIVVGAATIFRPIDTTFVVHRISDAQQRRAPSSVLKVPAVVIAFVARSIIVSLSPSSRGIPKSRLFAPTVVAAQFIAEQIKIFLAPSSRGLPKSKLKTPVVVGASVVFRPVSTTIAKQNLVQDRLTRKPYFKLLPPAVVFEGSQKGYHSRTKINSRESSLDIIVLKPVIVINDIESNLKMKRGTSRDRINDIESDLDIS